MVLTGKNETEVLERISEIHRIVNPRPVGRKDPKRANNMTKYTEEEERKGRANMPGHVRISMNWNKCRDMYGDKYSMPITDGAKVIVCKLKNNPGIYKYSISVDEMRIPEWFKELPFDSEAMEANTRSKDRQLIGVLDWDVQSN